MVTVLAVDEDTLPFLATECVVGQSLQERLHRAGSLRLAEILRSRPWCDLSYTEPALAAVTFLMGIALGFHLKGTMVAVSYRAVRLARRNSQ